MTRNEAAERLPDGSGHDGLGVGPEYLRGWKVGRHYGKAEERHRVIAQIRKRIGELPVVERDRVDAVAYAELLDRWAGLLAILDDLSATPPLATQVSTPETPDDPISDSRQPEDGPPPGRWPR